MKPECLANPSSSSTTPWEASDEVPVVGQATCSEGVNGKAKSWTESRPPRDSDAYNDVGHDGPATWATTGQGYTDEDKCKRERHRHGFGRPTRRVGRVHMIIMIICSLIAGANADFVKVIPRRWQGLLPFA